MFRTVPLSFIRSFSACLQTVSKPVWHISLLCVQWRTPDDGQTNCPKHVEFYSKNKFEKLVHLVGFIIRSEWLVSLAGRFISRGQSPWYLLNLLLPLNINTDTTMATMRSFRIVCSSNNRTSQNVQLNVISHSWCIPGKATAAPLYLTQTHVTYLPGTIQYTAT